MRAALLYGGRDLRVEDVPIPVPGCGEALVKVHMAGLCGSDQHRYTGERPVGYMPIILGHEYYGEVVRIGEGVDNVRVGEKVVGRPFISCGVCPSCLNGQSNICRSRISIGQRRPGCFAEYIAVPSSMLYHINDDVKPEDAVMSEPTGIVMRTISKAGNLYGKRVVVIGAGAMGLLTLRMCIQAGALCYSCDIAPNKLVLAKQFGAKEVINSMECDPIERVTELTGGRGPDVVIETAGITKTLEQAIEMASYGGRVVALGLATNKAGISPNLIAQKELTIVGSIYYVDDFQREVNMINERSMDYSGLISHILPLEKITEGFEMLLAGKEAVKVLIDMNK
jgi:2-desacetyl-2-hydroxyethyl bacteriochlorophyllide A dehydrogenase